MHKFSSALIAGLAMVCASPAFAHPHIFVDATATITFDADGAVASIRHAWTFDQAFSAYYTQGLDTDNDGITSSAEMQELADENVKGLSEYGFYTSMGEGIENLPQTGSNAHLDLVDGRARLTFTTTLVEPHRIREQLEIGIGDPEYYVAITFADASAVTLANPPTGCSARLEAPKELPDELADQLYALPSDVTVLPPELAAAIRGTQGAIVIACATGANPATRPATALEAVTAIAEAKPTPFGGPPPEPGLGVPPSGPLRWISDRQNEFYAALTASIARLKEDGNFPWLLGLLSFLYGVFHAAGPGHGKLVISAYMLATERQLRRGIALSFASALLQSLVAIGMVGIAAALLRLSTAAMNDATHWIGIGSYALVAALGLWLVARRIFGFGHQHRDMTATARRHLHDHAEHDHAHDHDHHHDDDDGHDHHHHVVLPAETGGDWREQLGVVFAAGLRPCSGALIVLVFALSQGVFLAGIVSTLLMGLGTGLTVAVLAGLAVSAKGLATRLAGGAGTGAAGAVLWWAELAGGLLVLGLGTLLLLASL